MILDHMMRTVSGTIVYIDDDTRKRARPNFPVFQLLFIIIFVRILVEQ